MREDSALSHLKDGELCVVLLRNGEKHKANWSVMDWAFFYRNAEAGKICRFEDIKEWMPASIKYHL